MCGTSWGPFCHVCLFAVEERRIFSPVGSRFSTGSLHRGFLGGFPRSKAQMGETKRMGQSHLGQPREGRQPKPIRQAENEIPVFALFAILANMDPRTLSELIAKKNSRKSPCGFKVCQCPGPALQVADNGPKMSRFWGASGLNRFKDHDF